MRLSHIVQSFVICQRIGLEDPEITHLTADSRQVRPGSLFVAIRGYTVDGHAFARDAARNGAAALMVETYLPELPIPQIVVSDTRAASGILATQFYGDPSSRLSVIGVTGTNGKTTVTHLIEAILSDNGAK
ncbi:MAG: Mur ligase domain-containing protein, partial [Sulfobacillus sp.]